MKRFILLSVALMLSIMLSAQTQQGYVKTKGRMVNGQIVHGQGLKGATVSIKGRTTVLVNSDNGAFSFPVPEAQFRIDSVRKKGYQLVDIDALSKTYKHSANPIYLVMETPDQQLQDQLAAERKIRRTLTNQLHQREDEIEALKEQQKISDEEYRQALQKLYEETEQNDQLVKDMVKRYSTIDYDQLNEFDQKISELILNGELTKADSMLRTKGDIKERAVDYKRHKAINAKEKEELSQRQEQLEQSELLAQKELEDIANDCYRKFEIFKMKHENDSAAYYLELRVSLDPMNIDWQMETSSFLAEYLGMYQQAKQIDSILINNTNYDFEKKKIAELYNHLGLMHNELSEYDEAMDCFSKALKNFEDSDFDNQEELSRVFNNLGVLYDNLREFDQALLYHQKALDLMRIVFGENSEQVANSYNNIGHIFNEQNKFDLSLEYCGKALTIFQSLYGNEHQDIGMTIMNIGGVYFQQGDYNTAFDYFLQAQKILLNTLGEYHPKVGLAYNNLGSIYQNTGDYDKAIEYSQKSITILKTVLGDESMIMAGMYSNLATIYKDKEDYQNAINYHEKSLCIYKRIYGENNQGSLYVAVEYKALGRIYKTIGDFTSAENSFKKALEIEKNIFESPNSYLYYGYFDLADLYFENGFYEKSYDLYNEMQTVTESLYGNESEEMANNLGNIYFSLLANYNQTNSEKELQKYYEFMSTHILTVNTIDGSVATQAGLNGSYYILSIEDWEFIQPQSIIDKIISLQGKPKKIVIMKDGVISEHYFENSLGMRTGFSIITKEEKQKIVDAYSLWKRQKKNNNPQQP